VTEFRTSATFVKVEESLGLIMGYAIVCETRGEDGAFVPYFDLGELQKDGSRIRDHITPDAMLKCAAAFMQDSRVACEMHARDAEGGIVKSGGVVFCWPMTSDIAKALGITVEKTGLLVAIKPDDPEALAKARRGEYGGFSIGGRRIAGAEEILP
jgi:hypothetical protein